jgi:signal peptidase I
LEVAQTIAIAVVAVLLVRNFIAQPFLVSGASMEPTFRDGDYLLVDEMAYRFREPARGEVIVFRYPGDRRSFYIKRVIGLPGERVVIKNGTVDVFSGKAGKVLSEPYIATGTVRDGVFETTLKGDEYFVMGDNRNFSFDSRNWGPLTRGDVVGLARFRLWPFQNATVFAAPVYP